MNRKITKTAEKRQTQHSRSTRIDLLCLQQKRVPGCLCHLSQEKARMI